MGKHSRKHAKHRSADQSGQAALPWGPYWAPQSQPSGPQMQQPPPMLMNKQDAKKRKRRRSSSSFSSSSSDSDGSSDLSEDEHITKQRERARKLQAQANALEEKVEVIVSVTFVSATFLPHSYSSASSSLLFLCLLFPVQCLPMGHQLVSCFCLNITITSNAADGAAPIPTTLVWLRPRAWHDG